MKFATTSVIIYFPLIVWGVTLLTFVWPSRLKPRGKLLCALLLLICALRGLAYRAIGGHAQAPELPEALLLIWDWAAAGLLLLAFLSLVWWMRRGRTWLLPLVSWGLAAWGTYNGVRLPEVHEVEICSPDLPAELDGYRIAQLTDLHCSCAMRGWRTRGIVQRINAAKPDFVCLTGDFVDGHFEVLKDDLAPLFDLRATDGIAAITGNHEFFIDWSKWEPWYEKNGLRFLCNECIFPRKGLAIAGVPYHSRSIPSPYPDVAKAFAAAQHGEFRVLMRHRPKDVWNTITQHHVGLMVCGHTHGGLMPGLAQLIALRNEGFVRGLYRIGTGWLYVSPGVGQWGGFPIRLCDPTEITIFVLRRKVGLRRFQDVNAAE